MTYKDSRVKMMNEVLNGIKASSYTIYIYFTLGVTVIECLGKLNVREYIVNRRVSLNTFTLDNACWSTLHILSLCAL